MNKVCPFLSRPVIESVAYSYFGFPKRMVKDRAIETKLIKVSCLGEDCIAWQPATYFCKMSPVCPRVDMAGCDMDTCTDAKKGEYTPGFCALIP